MMFYKIHYTCMKLIVFIIIRMYALKCIKGKENMSLIHKLVPPFYITFQNDNTLCKIKIIKYL